MFLKSRKCLHLWAFVLFVYRYSLLFLYPIFGTNTKIEMNKKITYLAYGFYIFIAFSWFATSLLVGGYLNYIALITLLAFIAQAYYKHRVANLIFGILILPASIFWALQFVWEGGKNGFDAFISIMSILSVISIVLSVILLFSYMKQSFNTDK